MGNANTAFGWGTAGGGGGGSGSGAAAMFAVSGTEVSFDQNRWLIPRRYKDGDYLSGASEDFDATELANQSFNTNIRLEQFIADGSIHPVRYEVWFAMQQTSLDVNMQFGIFKSTLQEGDSTISYAFTSYGSSQPYETTDQPVRLKGDIVETLQAGQICSFGFHNPTGDAPATQDIDDLKYWITVYFN